MLSIKVKSALLEAAALAVSVLLLGSSAAIAQTVNLTAKATTTVLPDGTTVPMWGLFCNDAGTGASCATLRNPGAAPASLSTVWSAGASLSLGTVAQDVNGIVAFVTTAGTTGTTVPTFNAAPGGSTPDGAVIWTTFGTVAQYQAGYSATWAPPVITVPVANPGPSSLKINLTNSLSFPAGSATPTAAIPTSLVIVGQLGGGLGDATQRTTTPSPDHTNSQPVTWPIAGSPPGAAPVAAGTPPLQGPRVQSFSTEVAVAGLASATGQCASPCALTWSNLKPGTYLIESGTHPSIQGPMGLYAVLVVTTAPNGTTAGTAYGTGAAAVAYNAEIPLLLSEIDPVQNTAVDTAVRTAGFSETATLGLVFNAPLTAISISSGGIGYTSAPGVTFSGGGGSGVHATAVIDTNSASATYQQVIGITLDTPGSGYTSPPQIIFSGGGGSGAAATVYLALGANNIANCSDATGVVKACYPPAVNYTPLYYLINGVAFDRTHASSSLFAASAVTGVTGATTGTVLVRLVNAGLRMHVPSIVGAQTGAGGVAAPAGFSLIAEDGNVLPGVPRVQSEVFMAAGKTNDVMINVPASGANASPIFDRELSLSGNAITRDAGMLAYISVGGAGLPGSGAFSVAATAVKANPDSYFVVGTNPLVVSDPAKGVLANDVNVLGVQVQGTVPGLTMNPDGTFTYSGAPTTFTYCGNGQTTGSACATVTLAACTGSCQEAGGGITMGNITYTANATFLKIQPPGILSVDKDGAGYPLTVNTASVTQGTGLPGALTLAVDANGGFNASVSAAGTYTFTYKAQNSQGTASNATGTVTLVFPAASGLVVTVLDGKDVLAAQQNAPGCTPGTAGCVTPTTITDYRWIIEEDRTFYVNPNCTTNPPPAGCPGSAGGTIVPTFGANFHTSYMPVIADGCTGQLSCEGGQTIFDPTSNTHINAVCDVGNGVCRPDTSGNGFAPHWPSEVYLNPAKRYYLTIFPGDAGTPFPAGNLSADCVNGVAAATSPGTCGHGMGGAPLAAGQTAVTVLTQPDPYPPAKLSVFVFEDDFPLNGEHDGGGGVDVLSPNEPGLGGFNITLFDDAGGTGDATGQMTYDMFNQPLVNSLAGTIDPATGLDACPVSKISRIGPQLDANGNPIPGTYDTTQTGITGTIVTCPKFESDLKTLSPLAGQAVIANLMPGRYGVVATPGADRIGRGEEWLQTNTLDGQKAHDSFLRIGEPSFFQEFGPAGWHVTIGFANPAVINARLAGVCGGSDPNITGNCTPGNTVQGLVTTSRMSRTPDERLYSSGDNSSFAFTQCYVSLGDPDGEDFAFTKCQQDGSFTLTGIPDGDWRVTVFDQWNDMLVDGLSTPVRAGASCPSRVCNLGQIATGQWQANIYTRTFFDWLGTGVATDVTGTKCTSLAPPTPTGCNTNYGNSQQGLTLVATNIRFRDGSYSNFNNTDLGGNAGFNEVFPLFSWYVIETDTTRYKSTGIHVVYDAGGPADGTPCGNSTAPPTAPCGSSTIGANLANTFETVSLPTGLRVPGAVYCANADCAGKSISGANGSAASDSPSNCTISPSGPSAGQTICTGTPLSTGRIDPPWVRMEGWQGFSGENSFVEFGKAPYAEGENGGIHGEVIYASTRPFDDPQLLLHTSWTPDVPGVTINLYQVGTAADGTQSLTLVDTTKTSSWDDWAQGFYPGTNKPYMNCPGQLSAPRTGAAGDLFYFTLFNQPMWLDVYANSGTPTHTIPNNSQFKCYDGMHNWNQVQPAVYDGAYWFPSIIGRDPTTGAPTGAGSTNGTAGSRPGTNCTICVNDPTDVSGNTPMLPAGQYVVEMIVPPGYELVKEEDKNILIGDNYIAPVTVQFPGLGGAIYILPDQATVGAIYNANQPASVSAYNATNAQNPTQSFGRASALPSHEGDTGSVESFWPCVGATRIVPDYISLFPQSHEVAPFAGAKRNLCDRKLVQLDDQTSALAKFWVFTSAHVASHFTGVITDDFTSEFDPFSPQFGEKFSPANLPVAIKDWTGQEISRVYADHWGTYNGLTYSTWEVNPPNPTGYAPTMMVTCMNDPGSGATPDPLFNPAYSQFCYEIPFMPGQTQYMDTPVVPTSAFAGAGYNNPDCDYPDATPAISEVDGDGPGPWVSASGARTLTITALGTVPVNNYAYNGPSATAAPYNAKTVNRTYSFGGTVGSASLVDANGVSFALTGVSWGDMRITGTVPDVSAATSTCPIPQQAQYGGTPMTCLQLVITRGDNGRQSIDTVTVTIGGKAPTHITPTGSIQAAIDAAAPGDMLMIDPVNAAGTTPVQAAVHAELLLMWKPVRLQGVGASASVINGNTHPAGKLDVWRREVNCLMGLSISGYASTGSAGSNAYDPSGAFTCDKSANFGAGPTTLAFYQPAVSTAPGSGGAFANPQVDRLPLEAAVGWNASLNGNLAELLQEPSLMGALEGATITVLSKGVLIPANATDIFGANSATAGAYPAGTTLLSAGNCGTSTDPSNPDNPFPSNFYCNPSSIDGLTIQNSSQGGGGIFVHGWGHYLQIANNRVKNNSGTLSGGINVGQGEFPGAYIQGGVNADPGSCVTSGVVAGAQLPYCLQWKVNVHHNSITLNSSMGDELFSATPAGAGGISFCTGSDYYQFNYNWLCGNLSTGDGGGLGHVGFSYNGDIEHNTIIFNQSTNPTIATNGGGIIVMGTPDADPTCGTTTDQDCLPPPAALTPSDGVGPNLMINANIIMGNAAESGSGAGIALQHVNGSDVIAFPNTPAQWHHVILQNNIIVDNVAGWDGGGISLLDALNTDIVNNTIASNVTTASSGMLFTTIGAPLASTHGSNCTNGTSASCPQPAGLVSQQTSAVLLANILALPPVGGLPAGTITCPTDHGNGGSGGGLVNGHCKFYSYPLMRSDAFWQNRAYRIGVGGLGVGPVNQQNVVTLYDAFTGTPGTAAPNQLSTGACTTDTNFWDLGVRGDTSPTNHSGGAALAPTYSVITSITGYGGIGNTNQNPSFASQYCDGSRTPPESGASGWQVPAGIADAIVPNPRFNLTPVATVDEGNNWINMRWGPLSMVNPVNGVILGDYSLAFGSPVDDYVPVSVPHPSTDFFGNARPGPDNSGFFDVGAIETTGVGAPVGPTVRSVNPPSGRPGTSVVVIISGTGLSAATNVTVQGAGVTAGAISSRSPTAVTTTFTIASTAIAAAHDVSVTTPGGIGTCTGCFTVAPATLTSITPNSGLRGSTNLTVNLVGTNLAGATGLGGLTGGVTLVTGSLVVNSSTSITASLNISATATRGVRNISVTFPTGPASNTVPFTVGPLLTSISPTNGVRGTSVPVTLTGVGLTGATAINVSGTNVTVSGISVVSDTTVTATLNIAPAAAASNRTVSVTVTPPGGAAGTTNTVTFTVTGATVTISAPSPLLTTTPANTTTKTGTITVSNSATATAPLTLTAAPSVVQTTPASPPAAIKFSITGGTCASGSVVNPGGSCTIVVQYAPGGVTTTATAHVSLANSGAASNLLNGPNFNGN